MKTTHHEEQEVTDGFNPPIKARRSLGVKVAAAVLIAVSAAGWVAPASTQAAMGAELGLAEIERGFWVCDRAATIDRIDSSTAMTCTSLAEVLKQRKFGGDFNAMLAWWQQHKEAEHLALANGSGKPPAQQAQTTPR